MKMVVHSCYGKYIAKTKENYFSLSHEQDGELGEYYSFLSVIKRVCDDLSKKAKSKRDAFVAQIYL